MSNREYKSIIREAGYNPTKEFVDELKAEHRKLVDGEMIDTVFKRLYRSQKVPPKGTPRTATEDKSK